MTDNLLDQQTTDDQLDLDPSKNYLEELVGDGKKFKSSEDLAKGKFEADQYIEVMKRRMDELRADYLKLREQSDQRASLEDIAKELREQRASNDQPKVNDEPNKPAFDPSQVENLVSKKIQEHEVSKKETDNFNKVKAKLQERYGTKYSDILNKQIEELGLNTEETNALARRSPTAFYKTFGLDQQAQQESFEAPPRSNRRGDSFAPTSTKKRTWSYYQELYKANPDSYFDPKVAIQMQKDALEQGEDFRDGNYYVKGLHDRY